ncbi:hypothetical protein B7494_g3061 [Chlorociboria aeruginascens]|nr:hypothetical protein B7494_g3061 [Chlorociboria aeruginascens]
MMVTELWTFSDDLEMLAWLDFCIQHCLKFDDTVTGHLAIRSKHSTITDIKSRLHRLWQIDRNVDPGQNFENSHKFFNPKELREIGSSYYSNLPESSRLSVQKILENYNTSFAQTRVNPFAGEQRKLGDKEESNRSPVEARQGCRSDWDQVNPPGLISPTERGIAKENGVSRMKTSKRPRDDNNVNTIDTIAKRASGISADYHESATPWERSNVNNSTMQSIRTNFQSIAGDNDADGMENSGQNHRHMNRTLEVMKRKYQEELAAKDIEIERMRDEWQVEIENLHEQEIKSIQKQEELQAENKHLMIAKHQRELNGRESLETNLFEKNQEIWRLTTELYLHRRAKSIANADECISIQTKTVDDAMDRIRLDLESIISGQNLGEHLHPVKLTLLTSVESLESLALCALGIDINNRKGRGELRTCSSKFESRIIIRAFILAAVRNWVFMTDFPSFAINKPSLLRGYRKVVMETGGWTRLHKLELEAYRISTSTPSFEDLNITRRATQLAIRLSKALAPLFPRFSDDRTCNEANDFETWGEDSVVWNNRNFRFKSIFKTALKLKVATVMTDQDFEFVVYPPGRSYLSNSNDSNLNAGSHSTSEHSEVGEKKWIHASFHVYKRNYTGSKTCIDDALIRSKNFVIKSQRDKIDSALHLHTKHILIAKRTVGNRLMQPVPPSKSTLLMSLLESEGERRNTVAKPPEKPGPIAISRNREQIHRPVEKEINNGALGSPSTTPKGPPPLKPSKESVLDLQRVRCTRCRKQFTSKKRLEEHQNTNSCKETLGSPKKFRKHQISRSFNDIGASRIAQGDSMTDDQDSLTNLRPKLTRQKEIVSYREPSTPSETSLDETTSDEEIPASEQTPSKSPVQRKQSGGFPLNASSRSRKHQPPARGVTCGIDEQLDKEYGPGKSTAAPSRRKFHMINEKSGNEDPSRDSVDQDHSHQGSSKRRASTTASPFVQRPMAVGAVSKTEDRLPSPAPSAPYATHTDTSPDYCTLDQSSGVVLETLTKNVPSAVHTLLLLHSTDPGRL